jgi:hypothetical protein
MRKMSAHIPVLHLLLEFFIEALPHQDDATVDGKAYVDKAMDTSPGWAQLHTA